jgi:hypothetical protein
VRSGFVDSVRKKEISFPIIVAFQTHASELQLRIRNLANAQTRSGNVPLDARQPVGQELAQLFAAMYVNGEHCQRWQKNHS